MSEFIKVRSITTGKFQAIPAHWLDNPVLGRDFEAIGTDQAPVAPAVEPDVAEQPTESIPEPEVVTADAEPTPEPPLTAAQRRRRQRG